MDGFRHGCNTKVVILRVWEFLLSLGPVVSVWCIPVHSFVQGRIFKNRMLRQMPLKVSFIVLGLLLQRSNPLKQVGIYRKRNFLLASPRRSKTLRSYLIDPSHTSDALHTIMDWTKLTTHSQIHTVDVASVARHKDLFPLDQSDYVGTALLSLGLMIAASGGIGGGGILVPILILIYGFEPKSAIALSNFAILGSSLTNVFISSFKRHPEADRPLVDWDLIMVMEPLTIAGAVIGALAGKVLPDWFLVVSLVLILGRTSWTTLAKAKSQYNKESAERIEVDSSVRDITEAMTTTLTATDVETETETESRVGAIELQFSESKTEGSESGRGGGDREMKREEDKGSSDMQIRGRIHARRKQPPMVRYGRLAMMEINGGQTTDRLGLLRNNKDNREEQEQDDTEDIKEKKCKVSDKSLGSVGNECKVEGGVGAGEGGEEMLPVVSTELARLLEEEKKTPVDKVLILFGIVSVTCGLSLLRGGGADFPSPVGIQCGSNEFWAVEGLTLAWIFGLSVYIREKLIHEWKLKKRLNYQYLPGDVEWNERNTIVYPCVCTFAGIVAGMFGFGGGIVKGPLMLQMGVHPLVASATSSVMIMFTASAATAMFIAFGTLTWDYAWFLFTVGLISTIVGQLGVGYFVNKYKRYSYISMSIGAVVSISTVLMSYQSITSFMEGDMTAGTICGF